MRRGTLLIKFQPHSPQQVLAPAVAYFDADAEAMDQLLQILRHAKEIMEALDRSGENI